MKEYTQEERQKAAEQIDALMLARPETKHVGALGQVAIDLQCDLNRAVELLKQVQQEGRTTSFLARAGEFIAHQEAR